MRKSMLIGALLVTGVLLSACSANADSNDAVSEEVVVYSEDGVKDSEDNTSDTEVETEEALVNSMLENTPVRELSEQEILEVYESFMLSESYDRAGEEIFLWLKTHNSDKVMDKLEYLKENVYGSEFTCTMYDADDNVISTSRYTFDEHGNETSVEYNIDDEDTYSLYTHQYVYDGDTCISELFYDVNGDIISDWEAVLDEAGNIVEETSMYDNLSTSETIKHTFKDGLCVREDVSFQGDDGSIIEEYIIFEYDGDLCTKQSYYTSDGELYLETTYEYDDDGYVVSGEEHDYDSDYISVYTYEYDSDHNMTREHMQEDTHEESYEYEYDKFGNNTKVTHYVHDTVSESMSYDYDFLGNVVIRTGTIDGVDGTEIHDYKYALKEK